MSAPLNSQWLPDRTSDLETLIRELRLAVRNSYRGTWVALDGRQASELLAFLEGLSEARALGQDLVLGLVKGLHAARQGSHDDLSDEVMDDTLRLLRKGLGVRSPGRLCEYFGDDDVIAGRNE